MLPELKVKIGADTTGLDRAVNAVARGLNNMESGIQRASENIKKFGGGVQDLGRKMLPLSAGVTALAGGMFALTNSTANVGDEIAKTSRAAGVSSDALQELRFALGQTAGVGDEQTSAMLIRLNRAIGEAAAGGKEQTAALEGLGISLEDIASGAVGTEQVFMTLVENMKSAESTSDAAAMGMALLGRQGAALGGKLREADADIAGLRDRAQELGIVLGSDTLDASEAFNDKMDELTKQMGAAKNAIGAALLPVALSLATAFQEKVVPAIVSMAGAVSDAINWFGQLPEGVQSAAGIIAAAFGVAGPALMAIGGAIKILGTLAALFTPAGLIITGLVGLAAAWSKWGEDIKGFTSDATDWVVTKFGEVVTFFQELPARFFEFGANIITGLWEGLQAAWADFDLLGTVGGWASSIGGRFKEALGIQSPSTVFHEFGMNIGEGLRNGIQSSFGMVRAAVQGLGDQTTKGAFDMAKGVVGAMGQMFQGSKPIAAAQALINTFQGITEALKLPFPASLAAAAQVAAQGFAAVRAISSAKPGGGTPNATGGGGAATGGGGAASGPQIFLDIQPNARGDVPMETFRGIIQDINDQLGRGGQIVGP